MTVETAPRRTEYVPLEHLQADPANPKAHDLEVIDASVGRFGVIDQIVRDDRTGYIISGHGRQETLRRMRDRGDNPPEGIRVDASGNWLVPVTVGWSSRTDAEARAALIALNKTTELGGWVDEKLLDLLDELDDYTGVGMSEEETDELRTKLDALAEPGDRDTKPADLDELAEEFGDITEEDHLVRVVLNLPPELAKRLNKALTEHEDHAVAVAGWLE